MLDKHLQYLSLPPSLLSYIHTLTPTHYWALFIHIIILFIIMPLTFPHPYTHQHRHSLPINYKLSNCLSSPLNYLSNTHFYLTKNAITPIHYRDLLMVPIILAPSSFLDHTMSLHHTTFTPTTTPSLLGTVHADQNTRNGTHTLDKLHPPVSHSNLFIRHPYLAPQLILSHPNPTLPTFCVITH